MCDDPCWRALWEKDIKLIRNSKSFLYLTEKKDGLLKEYCGQRVCSYLDPEKYVIWGGIIASGASVDWVVDQMAVPDALRKIRRNNHTTLLFLSWNRSPRAQMGPCFYHICEGSGAPYWDPKGKGAFLGLTTNHTNIELIRALFEGLSFQARMVIEMEENLVGSPSEGICAVGGGTRIGFWQQVKADITGHVIEIPDVEEASAFGAALLAGVGTGIFSDMAEAAQKTRRPIRKIEPNPENNNTYNDIYDIYKAANNSLVEINAQPRSDFSKREVRMKLGITLSTFPMKNSPVVFCDGLLSKNLSVIKDLGYQGVDLFTDSKSVQEIDELRLIMSDHGLEVAMYIAIFLSEQGVTLSCPNEKKRQKYIDLYRRELEKAHRVGTRLMPVGYLRGVKPTDQTVDDYYTRLADSLKILCEEASSLGITICLEPINRYEINTLNQIDICLDFIRDYQLNHLGLLLNSFHMNIEEASIENSIINAGERVKHFHAPDSNRLAAGDGHLDYDRILQALHTIRYDGYLMLEAFPVPDAISCARTNVDYLNTKLVDLINNRKAR